ncbi:DNA recombination protein RmuC [Candidatus Uhrbacteria bacterium]|nr:DNA recombination protein RmuC [Candidatus Uhrbacteria bacterium]
METSFLMIITILTSLVACAGVVLLLIRTSKQNQPLQEPQQALQAMTLLQNQVAQLQKEIGDRMGETHQAVRQQFSASTGIVRDITERMTKVEEISRQVLQETGELQKLQDILKNPKQRGILGEFFLENLLNNVLPPGGFQMQYKFANGEIVDAAIFIRDKIVSIDSKFSLENYNRIAEETNPSERERLETLFLNDLKLRIKETAKYIRPDEGTMDFAFMFIPHEAIYYDLLINKIGAIKTDSENLIQRAASAYHVIIVSPTSFLAYLQTVLQGLRALQIEEQAKEIKLRINEMSKHLGAYESYYSNVGKHLGTVVNQYNLASKEFAKIDKDVFKITGSNFSYQPELLEKPTINE